MFRFLVDKKDGDHFLLSSETLKHIKVSRVERENFICIYEERFFECKLENDQAKIINEIKEDHEHNGEVVIAVSIIETKNFELVVQKATELGATKLIPMMTKNVSKKINEDMSKKIDRWNTIALNATEQSFRNKKMVVTQLMNFNDVIKLNFENKYIAHEKQNSKPITSFKTNSIFLIGPEGGFTDQEVEVASKDGFEIISLGKRILRAETASIFVLSRVNS